MWLLEDWSACSAECGGGVRTRAASCANSSSGAALGDYLCGMLPATSEACHEHSCDAGCEVALDEDRKPCAAFYDDDASTLDSASLARAPHPCPLHSHTPFPELCSPATTSPPLATHPRAANRRPCAMSSARPTAAAGRRAPPRASSATEAPTRPPAAASTRTTARRSPAAAPTRPARSPRVASSAAAPTAPSASAAGSSATQSPPTTSRAAASVRGAPPPQRASSSLHQQMTTAEEEPAREPHLSLTRDRDRCRGAQRRVRRSQRLVLPRGRLRDLRVRAGGARRRRRRLPRGVPRPR